MVKRRLGLPQLQLSDSVLAGLLCHELDPPFQSRFASPALSALLPRWLPCPADMCRDAQCSWQNNRGWGKDLIPLCTT